MRLMPLSYIKEEHVLAKPVYDENNRILLMKGVKLKKFLVDKLKELGYSSVYIIDEYSTEEIEEILSPQTKNKAIMTISNIVSNISKLSNPDISSFELKSLKEKAYNNIESLKDVTKDIVDSVMSTRDVMVNLVDIKNTSNFTFAHSVNVAVLSLVLGSSVELNKNELHNLALGALLHDIGVIFVPKEIVEKRDCLNEADAEKFKLHTKLGYEHLGKLINIDPTVKIIALQHHEQLDGKGYPMSFDESKINKLSKIVAIADIYDLLTSNNTSEIPVAPHEAIEYLLGNSGSKFDNIMVKEFIRRVVPYPVGTLVKLSNNEIAIVEQINPDFTTRPIVRVINNNNVINLINEQNLVISGIQYAI